MEHWSQPLEEFDRWLMQAGDTVQVLIGGQSVTIHQEPHSDMFGSYLWDSALIMVKWFETIVPRHRLMGAKCIELGAGVGLVGIAVGQMGADITLTDVAEILPLLEKNVATNLADRGHVARLIWGEDVQTARELADPPPEFIIACECVYSEANVTALAETLRELSSIDTTIIMAGDFAARDTMYEQLFALTDPHFTRKKVVLKKMPKTFHHPTIELWELKLKKIKKVR